MTVPDVQTVFSDGIGPKHNTDSAFVSEGHAILWIFRVLQTIKSNVPHDRDERQLPSLGNLIHGHAISAKCKIFKFQQSTTIIPIFIYKAID